MTGSIAQNSKNSCQKTEIAYGYEPSEAGTANINWMPAGEKTLIAKIRRMSARTKSPFLRTGVGDDCAVLQLLSGRDRNKAQDILVTTDFSLEGVHFQRDWHTPESVGHRCLARGLSDIAAMGGNPIAAFLSLALPRELPRGWVDRFMRSLISLAQRYGIPLAGGDTAGSPQGILADIVVVGSVPKGKAILRSGARSGDLIYVSGKLGGAAAALEQMRKTRKRKLNPREYRRHFFPDPRIQLGATLRQRDLVSAMIDISDGLSTDLAHICEESCAGAEIRAEAIPRASVGMPNREVGLDLALHGGEDYELLFTARKGKVIPAQIAGVSISQIGQMTRSGRIFLSHDTGEGYVLPPRGWEHFRQN